MRGKYEIHTIALMPLEKEVVRLIKTKTTGLPDPLYVVVAVYNLEGIEKDLWRIINLQGKSSRNVIAYVKYYLSKPAGRIGMVRTKIPKRNLRIAKTLMIYALYEMKREGINIVTLSHSLLPKNTRGYSKKLYKSLGFEYVDHSRVDMELRNLQKRRLPKMYFGG